MTPESERVKLWRQANHERYNASQRALMKARRKKKKEEALKAGFSVTIVPYKP